MDPRTDRTVLTTVAYRTGDLLADRQQIYRYATGPRLPMPRWLFGLVGGDQALPEPIVDVGAGNGTYLAPLAGRHSVGLDLSRGMLDGLRRLGYRGPLVEADAQAIPLATASAGTAMANHMLYHVPDIAGAIRELRRVVRPGGLLLAITNGPDHTRELGDLRDTALSSVAGTPQRLRGAAHRFTLDSGAALLREVFDSVEVHDRRGEVVVPDVEPVVRYIASGVGLAGALPDGVSFADVVAAAEEIVRRTIADEGAFRFRTHAGAFVCR